jgi:hypothetical protein
MYTSPAGPSRGTPRRSPSARRGRSRHVDPRSCKSSRSRRPGTSSSARVGPRWVGASCASDGVRTRAVCASAGIVRGGSRSVPGRRGSGTGRCLGGVMMVPFSSDSIAGMYQFFFLKVRRWRSEGKISRGSPRVPAGRSSRQYQPEHQTIRLSKARSVPALI